MIQFTDFACHRATPPLCSDVCELIAQWAELLTCRRCGAVTGRLGHYVRMCFVRDEGVCFACYHRSRSPN